MSYHPEDRITRKDAAALARKSEDTIRRAEKKHDLAVETDPGTGQVTYRVGDLVDLDLIRITDVAIAGTAAESASRSAGRSSTSTDSSDWRRRTTRQWGCVGGPPRPVTSETAPSRPGPRAWMPSGAGEGWPWCASATAPAGSGGQCSPCPAG